MWGGKVMCLNQETEDEGRRKESKSRRSMHCLPVFAAESDEVDIGVLNLR